MALERLQLVRRLEDVGLLVDARDEVGLGRRRTRRCARAGRPGRGSAACRRASSACARSRPGDADAVDVVGARAARSRGPCWPPSRACGRGESASLTSCTERSWPTASGVIVFGKATMSCSGRTGSDVGQVRHRRRRPSRPAGPLGVTSITSAHDGEPSSCSSAGGPAIWTCRRLLAAARQRQLHPQDAVVVGRAAPVGHHVGAQLDLARERAVARSRSAGRRGPRCHAGAARR